MSDAVQKLKLYESRAVVSLQARTPGVYLQQLTVEGDQLLSSVFVASATGSVLVEYFETTTGQDDGEAVPLEAHPSISTATTDKIYVTSHHNKPFIKMTVTGGTVRFGVYVTVLSSAGGGGSSSSGDQFVEGHIVAPGDKGTLAAGVDVDSGEVEFLNLKDGKLLVYGSDATINPEPLNEFAENTVSGGGSGDIVTYTVPTDKFLDLALVSFTGNNIATYSLKIDGTTIEKSNTWFSGPLFGRFEFPKNIRLAEGQVVTLSVDNFRTDLGTFSGKIHGVLSDES